MWAWGYRATPTGGRVVVNNGEVALTKSRTRIRAHYAQVRSYQNRPDSTQPSRSVIVPGAQGLEDHVIPALLRYPTCLAPLRPNKLRPAAPASVTLIGMPERVLVPLQRWRIGNLSDQLIRQ